MGTRSVRSTTTIETETFWRSRLEAEFLLKPGEEGWWRCGVRVGRVSGKGRDMARTQRFLVGMCLSFCSANYLRGVPC